VSEPSVLMSARNLTVAYGRSIAVRDFTFSAHRGETVAILGSNGAGKTSSLRAVAGLVRPAGGTIVLDGTDITGTRPWKMFDRGVVYVPQGRRCFRGLTVEENLIVGASRRAKSSLVSERLDVIYELFPVLRDIRRRQATLLSGGQQQMVAIGRGLMSSPSVLLLDEPSLGLAPRIVADLAKAIERIARELNGCIVLVEQNVGLARQSASRGYVLTTGSCVAEGTVDHLLDKVETAYLG